jgi:thymidylate kinase
MKRMVVVSGPQAAGKSTCLKRLFDLLHYVYPCLPESKIVEPFILQEARQIVVHKYHLMGGIFMTKKQEREVIDIDFYRMDSILKELDERLLYFDECNVFTLAHAKAHQVILNKDYFAQYCEYLHKLNAVIIFLNVIPDVSWERRKDIYQSRLFRFPEEQRKDILNRYFEYLDILYPSLSHIYEKINLPKIRINANDKVEVIIGQIMGFLKKENVI